MNGSIRVKRLNTVWLLFNNRCEPRGKEEISKEGRRRKIGNERIRAWKLTLIRCSLRGLKMTGVE